MVTSTTDDITLGASQLDGSLDAEALIVGYDPCHSINNTSKRLNGDRETNVSVDEQMIRYQEKRSSEIHDQQYKKSRTSI